MDVRDERGGRTLILGVGNLLREDDGFGVHVVRRLASLDLPGTVDLLDGGTSGVDLLDAMCGYSRVILLDLVVPGCGGLPVSPAPSAPPDAGEILVVRHSDGKLPAARRQSLSLHKASIDWVMALAGELDITLPPIELVGLVSGATGWSTELSERGARGVERAIDAVLLLLNPPEGAPHGAPPACSEL